MAEGDTRYHVVRAGPKGGWSLMHTREGITRLYEDAKDRREVAVFTDDCLALASALEDHLNRMLGHECGGA